MADQPSVVALKKSCHAAAPRRHTESVRAPRLQTFSDDWWQVTSISDVLNLGMMELQSNHRFDF